MVKSTHFVTKRSILICVSFFCIFNTLIHAETQEDQSHPAESRLKGVMDRARDQHPITIAFFGGSITWGATATDPLRTSWRALVMEHLRTVFPHTPITFIDAAIGGQPSRLGAFRVDRDVIAYQPDLVFLEFTINDGRMAEADQTYEGIIRKIRSRLPQTAIVPVIVGAGRTEYVSPSREKHMAVAKYYGLPVIDLVVPIRQKMQAGLKLPDILTDGVHPNDAGYALYAQIVIDEFDRLVKSHVDKSESLPAPMTGNKFETAAMLELSKLDLPTGWKDAKPSAVGTWFDHTPSRWFDSVIQPTQTDAVLRLPLQNLGHVTGLGLYFERLPGGKHLILEVNDKTFLSADSSNQFNFARVNYLFKFLTSDATSVVLRAPDGGPAAIAYLLYTASPGL
jgi:lysophospholipase L1-like esterase